jgi:hypothetical protein
MYRELSEVARLGAAKSTLNGLMTWLGETGLRAAANSAGLLAGIDQHAASVRDALGDPEHGPGAVSLAGYATGVRDALIEFDWKLPPVSEVDWDGADWPTMRLLGVCALARALGHA